MRETRACSAVPLLDSNQRWVGRPHNGDNQLKRVHSPRSLFRATAQGATTPCASGMSSTAASTESFASSDMVFTRPSGLRAISSEHLLLALRDSFHSGYICPSNDQIQNKTTCRTKDSNSRLVRDRPRYLRAGCPTTYSKPRLFPPPRRKSCPWSLGRRRRV